MIRLLPLSDILKRWSQYVLVAMLICPAGCFLIPREVHGVYQDRRIDQPFDAVGGPASPARVSVWRQGPDNSHKFVEWPSGTGEWIDSRDLVRKAQMHLERCGTERREFHAEPASIDLVHRTPSGFRSPLNLALEPIWTIVSLRPTILVETAGTIQHYSQVQASPPDAMRQPGEIIHANVFLNGGFHYGLHLPYAPEPRWTSPEAGTCIFDSREVSATQRMIDHPTRPLRLVRDGEVWRVELASQP